MVAHTVKAAKAAVAAKAKPRKKGSYTVTKPTGAVLTLARPYFLDRAVRWAQDNGYCNIVEDALDFVFGTRPKNGWRDSEGYDCDGLDLDGYDRDDRDESGYHRMTGLDEEGYDRQGWDERGINRFGRPKGNLPTDEMVNGWPPYLKDEIRAFFEKERAEKEAAAENAMAAGEPTLSFGL